MAPSASWTSRRPFKAESPVRSRQELLKPISVTVNTGASEAPVPGSNPGWAVICPYGQVAIADCKSAWMRALLIADFLEG